LDNADAVFRSFVPIENQVGDVNDVFWPGFDEDRVAGVVVVPAPSTPEMLID
jgi:hypothetical protein